MEDIIVFFPRSRLKFNWPNVNRFLLYNLWCELFSKRHFHKEAQHPLTLIVYWLLQLNTICYYLRKPQTLAKPGANNPKSYRVMAVINSLSPHALARLPLGYWTEIYDCFARLLRMTWNGIPLKNQCSFCLDRMKCTVDYLHWNTLVSSQLITSEGPLFT